VPAAHDADFIKQTLQFALQRLIMDVEAMWRNAYGERSDQRINSRKGYRDRLWKSATAQSAGGFPSWVTAARSWLSWSRTVPQRKL
jgi:hypothetical protein